MISPSELYSLLDRKVPDEKFAKLQAEIALKENVVVEPPVLAIDIARSYRIEVLFASFPPTPQISGVYNFRENTILVNTEDAPDRQTFAIAHELGHAMLHKKVFEIYPDQYQVLQRSPIGAAKDPLELEANVFGASLLVPRKFLDKYYKRALVGQLARLFIVPEDVIRYRLQDEYSITA